MFDIVLTSAERALLEALSALGVRYLIVGMGAALIEGAPGTTQDIDLWFERLDTTELREAARRAGGFYTSGLGLQPPAVGGEGSIASTWCSPRRDSSPSSKGFARAREYDLDGVRVRVLPLERIIVNKRAAKRPKDSAQLPMLEAALAARRARTEKEPEP